MAELVRKPLSWLKQGKHVREDFGTEEELRSLGECMRDRQTDPILALSNGVVIAGFRQIEAAKSAGLTEVEVKIYTEPLTELDQKLMYLRDHLHRKDLTAYERWKAYTELWELKPEWTAKEFAKQLRINPSAVTIWTSPSKCIPAWKDALKVGQVRITDCYLASTLTPEQQFELLKMNLAGMSRDQLKLAADRIGATSIERSARSSRIAIPLSDGSKVVISKEKMSLSDVHEILNQCLKAVRMASKRGLDAKAFQTVMRGESQAANSETTLI